MHIDLVQLFSVPNPSRKHLQAQVLCLCIDNYQTWRSSKDALDNRGYDIGWFTWLRHFTNFGLNRAYSLRSKLLLTNSDPISILKEHFSSNSRLGNHSLDTFLLEGILATRSLFDISSENYNLKFKHDRMRLLKTLMKQDSNQEDSDNNGNLINKFLSYDYNPFVLSLLQHQADNGVTEAQYLLGNYYLYIKVPTKAFEFLFQVIQKGHAPAKKLLEQSSLTQLQCLDIAKRYEAGDGLPKDETSSVLFYEKASALGSKEAALYLGEFYQVEHEETPKDDKRAFQAYLQAARLGAKEALASLERLAALGGAEEQSSLIELYAYFTKNPTMGVPLLQHQADNGVAEAQYLLGKYYFHKKEPTTAFPFLFKAIERGHAGAKQLLEQSSLTQLQCLDIAKRYEAGDGLPKDETSSVLFYEKASALGSKKAALYLGEFYQVEHEKAPKDDKRAFQAYLQAARLGAKEALASLERLATLGGAEEQAKLSELYAYFIKNPTMGVPLLQNQADNGVTEAQYLLGNYYLHKNEPTKAFEFLFKAIERGHAGAKQLLEQSSLTQLQCLDIAKRYEAGDGLPKDETSSVLFYEKASALGSKEAALYLGEFYQVEHEKTPKDDKRAFQAYLQAAKLGNEDALVPLERLAEAGSSDEQKSLSGLYASFFNNSKKAKYWKKASKTMQALL